MCDEIEFKSQKGEVVDTFKLDQVAAIFFNSDEGVKFHHTEAKISTIDMFNILVELTQVYHAKVKELMDANNNRPS